MKEQQFLKKGKIEKIFDYFQRHPKKRFLAFLFTVICGLFTVFSTVLGVYQSVDSEAKKEIEVKEILVGLAPFHINDIPDLENKHLVLFKNANIFLRERKSEYRLTPYISKRGYEGVLHDLKEGEIKIASISQCLFARLINDKICGYNWKSGSECCLNSKKTSGTDDFVLIGYKKKGGNRAYKSGFLYHKQNGAFLDSCIFDKLERMHYSDSIFDISLLFKDINIILGTEEFSTSSHVLPEVYLLERGINLKLSKRHEKLSRSAMKDAILKNKNDVIIGFVSDEDYDRIDWKSQKDSLCFRPILIPIPYDAIVVNKKWWNRIGEKNQKIIEQAIDVDPMGFIPEHCIDDKYKTFHEYLLSGIIYKVNKDTGYVEFPDIDVNIFKFNFPSSEKDSVVFVKYLQKNKNSDYHIEFNRQIVGEGIIKGNKIFGEGIELGLHLLPKKYIQKNK